jgi:hypothetical protein
MHRKKPKDHVWTVVNFYVLGFVSSMVLVWSVAWWCESRGLSNFEKQHATCFAKRYILEQYFHVSDKEASKEACLDGNVGLMPATTEQKTNAVANLSRATERAFIFPWPEIGLSIIGIVIFQIKQSIDGKARSRNE